MTSHAALLTTTNKIIKLLEAEFADDGAALETVIALVIVGFAVGASKNMEEALQVVGWVSDRARQFVIAHPVWQSREHSKPDSAAQ